MAILGVLRRAHALFRPWRGGRFLKGWMAALTVRGYYDSLLRTVPAATRTVAVGLPSNWSTGFLFTMETLAFKN